MAAKPAEIVSSAAGAALDAYAKELQFHRPDLSYRAALDRAFQLHPTLYRAYAGIGSFDATREDVERLARAVEGRGVKAKVHETESWCLMHSR